MNKEETIESLCRLADILEDRGEINLWCEIIQILNDIDKNECSGSIELAMAMNYMDKFGFKYDPEVFTGTGKGREVVAGIINHKSTDSVKKSCDVVVGSGESSDFLPRNSNPTWKKLTSLQIQRVL